MTLDKLIYNDTSYDLEDKYARDNIKQLQTDVNTLKSKDVTVEAGKNITVFPSTDGNITTYAVSGDSLTVTDDSGEITTKIPVDGKTYTLKQGTDKIFDINIAADMVVDNGITLRADGTQKKGTSGDAENADLTKDKIYLRLHIANADAMSDYIYILATDLGIVYSAGTNITITDGIISAKDTTYTAGTDIKISDGAISANCRVMDRSAQSSDYTIQKVNTLTIEMSDLPTDALFVGVRCSNSLIFASNGWIANGTGHCTLVNYSSSAQTTKVEFLYSTKNPRLSR